MAIIPTGSAYKAADEHANGECRAGTEGGGQQEIESEALHGRLHRVMGRPMKQI